MLARNLSKLMQASSKVPHSIKRYLCLTKYCILSALRWSIAKALQIHIHFVSINKNWLKYISFLSSPYIYIYIYNEHLHVLFSLSWNWNTFNKKIKCMVAFQGCLRHCLCSHYQNGNVLFQVYIPFNIPLLKTFFKHT